MKRRYFFAILGGAAASAQDVVFRASARLVEVHATIRDRKGRYVEGLRREDFEVTDAGQPQRVETAEENRGGVSCALLLDTTGSMLGALPTVKNAILKLIDSFRPQDSVSVYSFASSLDKLSDFTTDRPVVKRAVLSTRASGRTALFDAVSVVSGVVSKREGMKAIVLFTDGTQRELPESANGDRAGQARGRAGLRGRPG